MITKEILANVRRIEIRTRRIVNEITAGAYHSVFKGRGVEFAEVREYLPGDDIRTIDWNVTARMGAPFIKKFQEERDMTVFLMVDISASGDFGSQRSRNNMAAEIAAVLSFSAIRNKDHVGLMLFSDKEECSDSNFWVLAIIWLIKVWIFFLITSSQHLLYSLIIA